jgi:hypothetical protein
MRSAAEPDLVTEHVAAARTASGLSVAFSVSNVGRAAAPASRSRVYLSADSHLDASDVRTDITGAAPSLRPRHTWRGVAELTTAVLLRAESSAQSRTRFRVIVCADNRHSVHEVNESNNCAASASISFGGHVTPPPPPPSAPGAPQNLHVVDVSNTAAAITWSPPTSGSLVDHYELFVSNKSFGATTTTLASFTGLVCGTVEVIGVEAVDRNGHRSTRATLTVQLMGCGGTSGGTGGSGGSGGGSGGGGSGGGGSSGGGTAGNGGAEPTGPVTIAPAQAVAIAGTGGAVGVTLDVPSTAFPSGTSVQIAATTVADAAPGGATANAYEIQATTEPSTPVQLTVPVPGSANTTDYVLAWWSDDTQTWQPVPTSHDDQRHVVSAEVTHFSKWWAVPAHWLLKQTVGAPGSAPACSGLGPAWVKQVSWTATDDLGLAMSCAGDGPNNQFEVTVAPNHNAAIYVTFNERPVSASYETDVGIRIPVSASLMFADGSNTRIYLPQTFTLHADFAQPAGTVDKPVETLLNGDAGRDVVTYLFDVMTFALQSALGDWPKTGPLASSAMVSCMSDLIDIPTFSLKPAILNGDWTQAAEDEYKCFVDSVKANIRAGRFDGVNAEVVARSLAKIAGPLGVINRAQDAKDYASAAVAADVDRFSRSAVITAELFVASQPQGTSDRDTLVTQATGKIVTVAANGTSYFFDGSRLHWISDDQTYWCLIDSGRSAITVDTQYEADLLGNGQPWQAPCLSQQRTRGHVVREALSGASYTVSDDGLWHWIPDGGTYNCLIATLPLIQSDWAHINSLRGSNGEHEGAHASCTATTPPRDAIAAAATNKIVSVSSTGTSYFFDGTTLHWIPDDQTYWCLVDSGKQVYQVTAQADADLLGSGQPWQPQCFSLQRIVGHIVRENSTGASYTVSGDGLWHWIPDGGTFNCLATTMAVIQSDWAQINSLRGPNGEHEGAHASCGAPPPSERDVLAAAATGKVLTVDANGTSYYFDGTTLHWIPDSNTYWCLVDGGRGVYHVSEQRQADLLGSGQPWQPQCFSLQRIVGHIVRETSSGASYTVSSDGLWHWIPDGGTFNCLAVTMSVVQSNWSQINSLRGPNGEHEGAHASCGGAPASGPTYQVANSGIGVRLRHSPHANDTYPPGVGPYDGYSIQLLCQDWGDAMGPRNNHVWDYIAWNGYRAWIPDAYTNTPAPSNQYTAGIPHPCPTSVGGSG